MRLPPRRPLFLLFLVPAVLLTYSTVFTTGRLPGGELSDTVTQGYPFFTYTAEALREGSLPHWNPYVFCGIPFYSSFSAPVFYPLRGLLLLAAGVGGMIRFLFPLQMLLGGIFAWLFLGSIGVSRWGRIVGCMAFATAGWSNTLFYAGHGSKMICWSFLPLLLFACERWMQTRRGRFIAAGATAMGMQALSSHPQMVLYSAMAAVLWIGFRCFSRNGSPGANIGAGLSGLLAIVLLAAALGAVQLLPGYNFSRYSTRGDDLSMEQAASYSLPPEETLTMLFPRLFGYRHGFPGSTISGVPLYYGRLGLRLSSEFTGVLVFLLALAAFIGSDRKYRWPLLAIGATGLMVSWGGYTPVFGVLYRLVPVLRKLRAPHMAAFLTTSAVALASGPGFDTVFAGKAFPARKFLKGLLVFSGICVLVFLLADTLLPGLQSGWWGRIGQSSARFRGVVDSRVSMAAPDFIRAALAAALLAGLIRFREKLEKGGLLVPGVILALLVPAETVPLNREFQVYLRETDTDRLFEDRGELAAMAGEGRLLPGGNSMVPSHIRSVMGYHAAKPAVAQDMQTLVSAGGVTAYRQTSFTVMEVQGHYLTYEQFRELVLEDAAASGTIHGDTLAALLPEEPLPRAWFAASWVELSEEVCLRLLAGGLNPESTTVLYGDPGLPGRLDVSAARAEIAVDEPNRVVVRTENPHDGLLVLSDTWYPRWEVLVDGEPSPMLRANHWQRGVALPAGTREVEFRFDSSDVSTGLAISLIGLLSVLALAGADLAAARRGRKAE